MVDISKIVNEEINRYIKENVMLEGSDTPINEDLFTEKRPIKAKNKKKKNRDIAKNAKKLRNGLRADFDRKKDKETNPNLINQDAEDISDLIDSDAINTAAVAKELYPDHTEEGAQSQLRKKVKGLENDNGSKYKLKKKEAYKLNRIISKILHKI